MSYNLVVINTMDKIKKAIILAGGKGTRLYPVTLEIPKPLLTVNKRPIINYLIEMFGEYGVQDVIVTIRNDDQEDFNWWLKRWKDKLGDIKVNFVLEKEPMGTLGYWAHHLYKWTGNELFFFTNGDELKDVDLLNLTEHHNQTKALATIAAVEVPNPSEYGVIVFSAEDIRLPDGQGSASSGDGNFVEGFLEKPENPPSNFISSGLYLLDPAIRNYVSDEIKEDKKFLMIEKDVFPKLTKDKKLAAYKSYGKWFDCGNLERWERAIKEWDN